MQIGSTELLIILIVVIIAYGFYKARLSPPTRSSSARGSQQPENGRAGDGNPEGAWSAHPGNQAGSHQTASAKDPYVVLNIPRNATQDEVSAAYRKLAQMYHPDKVAGLAPEYYEIAEEKMKDINAAYEQIRNQPGAGR
jgi:DnaJ-domain-containing protein 1